MEQFSIFSLITELFVEYVCEMYTVELYQLVLQTGDIKFERL